MADDPSPNNGPDAADAESQARRAFLKRIGKASATVPAVTLLLAANYKRASATPQTGGGGCGCGGGGSILTP